MGIGRIPIKNHGRTIAIPTSFSVGWKIATILPESPIYSESVGFNHPEIIKGNDLCEVDGDFTIELSEDDISQITKGIAWLWFYGPIKFRDFMNEGREARFCWRLANRNPRGHTPHYDFASDGDPPEAYIKADDAT